MARSENGRGRRKRKERVVKIKKEKIISSGNEKSYDFHEDTILVPVIHVPVIHFIFSP